MSEKLSEVQAAVIEIMRKQASVELWEQWSLGDPHQSVLVSLINLGLIEADETGRRYRLTKAGLDLPF